MRAKVWMVNKLPDNKSRLLNFAEWEKYPCQYFHKTTQNPNDGITFLGSWVFILRCDFSAFALARGTIWARVGFWVSLINHIWNRRDCHAYEILPFISHTSCRYLLVDVGNGFLSSIKELSIYVVFSCSTGKIILIWRYLSIIAVRNFGCSLQFPLIPHTGSEIKDNGGIRKYFNFLFRRRDDFWLRRR